MMLDPLTAILRQADIESKKSLLGKRPDEAVNQREIIRHRIHAEAVQQAGVETNKSFPGSGFFFNFQTGEGGLGATAKPEAAEFFQKRIGELALVKLKKTSKDIYEHYRSIYETPPPPPKPSTPVAFKGADKVNRAQTLPTTAPPSEPPSAAPALPDPVQHAEGTIIRDTDTNKRWRKSQGRWEPVK